MSSAERFHCSESGDEGDINCILMNKHGRLRGMSIFGIRIIYWKEFRLLC